MRFKNPLDFMLYGEINQIKVVLKDIIKIVLSKININKYKYKLNYNAAVINSVIDKTRSKLILLFIFFFILVIFEDYAFQHIYQQSYGEYEKDFLEEFHEVLKCVLYDFSMERSNNDIEKNITNLIDGILNIILYIKSIPIALRIKTF